MDIEQLRLNDEEIQRAKGEGEHRFKYHPEDYVADETDRVIANTATKKAIEKIIEHLEMIVEHNEDGWAIIPYFSKEIEALKKLGEE